MVKIRLARYGTTKRPFYRIVAADSRKPRDGRYLEILGTYDPLNTNLPKNSTEKKAKGIITMKTDRLIYWLGKGAQMTDTVRNIAKREKLLETTEKAAQAAISNPN